MNWKQHILSSNQLIKEALKRFDELAQDAILFIVNEKDELIGSLTDGDIRRGLLKGVSLDATVVDVIQRKPHFIRKNEKDVQKIIDYRNRKFKIVPILNEGNDQIIGVLNFRLKHSNLPIDAVIMAGGKGMRLRPLTENTPKPLLKVGDKPIIEHNIDRLSFFGIQNLWISVNHMGNQIEAFVENNPKDLPIKIIREEIPMGTIGAVGMIKDFKSDTILVCNADLLTNIDYESFYLDFLNHNADLSIASIPYNVEIPYAVLELEDGLIKDFKEKPTYTYYSNGGIYLMKQEMLKFIPKDVYFSATDLMNTLIEKGFKIRAYPHHGYWLDIGKHDDYQRAQQDIKLFNL